MRKHIVTIAVFACFLSFAGTARAIDLNGLQPVAPYGVFSTHTAASPEKGKAVLGTSYENYLTGDFYRISSTAAFGLLDRLQLSSTISYNRDGLEDLAFGLKHRILDEERFPFSAAYMLLASITSNTEGVSTDGRFGGSLILSKKVGPVQGHANVTFAKPGSSSLSDEVSFSAGFVFTASRNAWIMGELYGRSSHLSRDIDQAEIRVGTRFLLAKSIYATLGIGVDAWQTESRYRLMASLAIVFPPDEERIERIYEEE